MSRYVTCYASLLSRRAANFHSFTPINSATVDLGLVGLGLRPVSMLSISAKYFRELTGSSCVAGASSCSTQLLSLAAWHEQQNYTPVLRATASQRRAHRRVSAWWLAAGAFAAACAPQHTQCEASTYAAERQHHDAWWSRLLHNADPRRLLYAKSNNAFIQEMQVDPKVLQLLLMTTSPKSMRRTSTYVHSTTAAQS